MSLDLRHRSYGGKQFRPLPLVDYDTLSKLLVIATPWGTTESAQKAVTQIKDYLALAQGDREVTSPFQKMSCLSTSANNLRISMFLANEQIYREENSVEYKTGLELLCGVFDNEEFVWAQVGQPQIFLSRKGRGILPLATSLDLAMDLSSPEEILPALPNQLLGLDNSVNMTVNSVRLQSDDKLIFLSHSVPPAPLFTLEHESVELERLSRMIASSYPQLAFWIGILNIGQLDSEV